MLLCLTYASLVVSTALFHAVAYDDWRFPSYFLTIVAVTGLFAWGLHKRRRWAWRLAAIFAAWQIYSGSRILTAALRAGVMGVSASAKVLLALIAGMTLIMAALLLLLVFFTDREKLYKT